MPVSLFSSAVFSGLYSDNDLSALFDDAADVQHMVRFEQALAKVQGALGVIPRDAAAQIETALSACSFDPADLSDGTRSAGVPVPALIALLRKGVGAEAGTWLHWGATSQDVMDTAAILQMKSCLEILDRRLQTLIDTLETESTRHAAQLLAGRTRSQISTPVTLGYRIAQWAHPLIGLEADLPTISKKLLKVQFGGASGINSAVAPDGPRIAEALAKELQLEFSPSWHTDRSGILALSGWLQSIAASLAKMAGDLILLGRTDIAEVTSGSGGGSSTMPQKANPVQAEAIQTLNAIVQTASSGLATAASPLEERDGARWPLEWAFLPQMLMACGAALRHTQALAGSIEPNPGKISRTLTDNPEIMAEAASFELARHGVPRAKAKDIVTAAAAADIPLKDALAHHAPEGIDWAEALALESVIPAAKDMSAQIFAKRAR